MAVIDLFLAFLHYRHSWKRDAKRVKAATKFKCW